MLVTYFYLFHLTSITKPFLSTQSSKITTCHPTFAYTHPTSHTNTQSLSFHTTKKKNNLKTKLTPITKFQISSNKNINKNIKPNNNTIIKNLTIQIYQEYILNISIIISYSSKKNQRQISNQTTKEIHDTYP